MMKLKWIDTADLPNGHDIADLVESGVTGKNLVAWVREHIRDGAPQVSQGDRLQLNTKKAKPKPDAPDPPRPDPITSQVVPIARPDDDDDLVLDGVPLEYSDDALADKFSEQYANDLKFIARRGVWMHWNGARWVEDEAGNAINYARKVARDAATEAAGRPDLGRRAESIGKAIASRRTIVNIEQLARTDPRHRAGPDQFDSDPWLLNTPGGVVELKTGTLRESRREDWCSKSTKYTPEPGDCPVWTKFIEDATEGDPLLIRYLQKVGGYAMTGCTSEQKFFFIYGGGGNGKGTYMNFLYHMLQDYSKQADMQTFTEKKFQTHPTDLAELQGARLVKAEETATGQRWDESKIKSLTGGDPVTARYMRQDNFTYIPVFKLLFAGNQKPSLRNVDAAIKRRLYMIPFDFTVAESQRINNLDQLLDAEGPQIMAWFLEGCSAWQEESLDPPPRVLALTEDYFEQEDQMGQFIAEYCDCAPQHGGLVTELYAAFGLWAQANGEKGVTLKTFRDLLTQKGYHSVKRGGWRGIVGIRVKPEKLPTDF